MTRVMQVSCIVSPHQMPLARCLAGAVGEDSFRYAATVPPLADRLSMGWNGEDNDRWVLRAGEDQHERAQFLEWWDKADVVLCGERLFDLMARRIRLGKLTIYMSERWWKAPFGMARMLHPRFASMSLKFLRLTQSRYFHYFPIGYYAATDMTRLPVVPDRMWLWGYFTELPSSSRTVGERNGPLTILYAGRLLPWKRVDTLIRAFLILRKTRPDVRLRLIGDGPSRPALQNMVLQLGLEENVCFEKSMPMQDVWECMRRSHIYVLPSNGHEGWGAVVNEAMSLGCAVVASDAGGSAKTMIQDGINGFLFSSGDWRRLGETLVRLSEDDQLRERVAENAQKTIGGCWSPRVAADRFLAVVDALLSEKPCPVYYTGPMSKV